RRRRDHRRLHERLPALLAVRTPHAVDMLIPATEVNALPVDHRRIDDAVGNVEAPLLLAGLGVEAEECPTFFALPPFDVADDVAVAAGDVDHAVLDDGRRPDRVRLAGGFRLPDELAIGDVEAVDRRFAFVLVLGIAMHAGAAVKPIADDAHAGAEALIPSLE